MERAAADAELFCCFGSVSGALIQSSHDEPHLVLANINQVLACEGRDEQEVPILRAL